MLVNQPFENRVRQIPLVSYTTLYNLISFSDIIFHISSTFTNPFGSTK